MSVNAFGQNFPAPHTKIIDPDDTPSDPWTQFFQSIWNRTGQGNGIIPSVQTGIAGGVSLATAFQLTRDWNDVSTSGGYVAIPPLAAGQDILVFNSSGGAINVVPPSGMSIDALPVNSAYVLASLKMQIFLVFSSTKIRSMQLG